MASLQALVFDVFGTVVDWREGVARDLAAFFARHGAATTDARAVADAWRRRYQPSMEECRSGRRPFTRLDVLHRENLDAVLSEHGVDLRSVDAAELDELNRAWHRLDPWPDSVPGLLRMKARYVVAPLSNGNVALLLNMAKRAGLPWDAILGAEVAGAYKPQPEAYLRTADILGLRPGAGVPGGRAQQRPRRRARVRAGDCLRAARHGARPCAGHRSGGVRSMGLHRVGLRRSRNAAGMLTRRGSARDRPGSSRTRGPEAGCEAGSAVTSSAACTRCR